MTQPKDSSASVPAISATSSDAAVAFAPNQPVGVAPEGPATQPVASAMLGEDQAVAEPPSEANFDAGTVRPSFNTVSTASLGSAPAISAVTGAQFSALTGRVTTLEGRVDTLSFQLSDLDNRTRGDRLGDGDGRSGNRARQVDLAFDVGRELSWRAGPRRFATGQIAEDLYLSAGVSGNTAEGDIGTRATVLFGF